MSFGNLMQQVRATGRRLVLSLTLAAYVALTAASIVTAQSLKDLKFGESRGKALRAIAEIIATHGYDETGQLLSKLHYNPVGISEYAQLPSVRKLISAYLAAEQVEHGSGERLLALLASDLAQRYQSVRSDPAVRRLVAMNVDVAHMETVLRSASTVRMEESLGNLEPRIESAIRALSPYLDGSAFGGMESFLQKHFGLSANVAFELLRQGGSNEDVLRKAMSLVGESDRDMVLVSAVGDLYTAYHPPSHPDLEHYRFRRKDLAVFAHENGRSPQAATDGFIPPRGYGGGNGLSEPGNGLIPSGGGSGSGGGGISPPEFMSALSAPPTESLTPIMQRTYPVSEMRSFGGLRMHLSRPGGILFGNNVQLDVSGHRIAGIGWIADATSVGGGAIAGNEHGAAGVGRVWMLLVSRTGDTTMASYGPVVKENAWAAQEVVYDSLTGVPPWMSGEGIALASIEQPMLYFDCGPDSIVNEGVRWQVLLHHNLQDHLLGWDAMLCDLLPIKREWLAAMADSSCGHDASARLGKWLDSTDALTWKVTDAPLVIQLSGNSITVHRASTDAPSETAIARRYSCLDFVPFDEDAMEADSAEPSSTFPAMVPILTCASGAYAHLNDFAPVLALYRWARTSGAPVTFRVAEPLADSTPRSVVILDNGLLVAPNYTPAAARRELLMKLDKRLFQVGQMLPHDEEGVFVRMHTAAHSIAETGLTRDSLVDRAREMLRAMRAIVSADVLKARHRSLSKAFDGFQSAVGDDSWAYALVGGAEELDRNAVETRTTFLSLLRSAAPRTAAFADSIGQKVKTYQQRVILVMAHRDSLFGELMPRDTLYAHLGRALEGDTQQEFQNLKIKADSLRAAIDMLDQTADSVNSLWGHSPLFTGAQSGRQDSLYRQYRDLRDMIGQMRGQLVDLVERGRQLVQRQFPASVYWLRLVERMIAPEFRDIGYLYLR